MTPERRVGDQRRRDPEKNDARERPEPLLPLDHRSLADGGDWRHAGRPQRGHKAGEHRHEHAEEQRDHKRARGVHGRRLRQ